MNKKTYLCEATMWMKKKVCIFIKIVFFAYLQKILLKNVNFLLIKPLCGYIKIHILHNSIFLDLLKGVIFFFLHFHPLFIHFEKILESAPQNIYKMQWFGPTDVWYTGGTLQNYVLQK